VVAVVVALLQHLLELALVVMVEVEQAQVLTLQQLELLELLTAVVVGVIELAAVERGGSERVQDFL
jgi:hypothetical protein